MESSAGFALRAAFEGVDWTDNLGKRHGGAGGRQQTRIAVPAPNWRWPPCGVRHREGFMGRIRLALRRLYGLPCWNVERGYGSFLTLEFGRPNLRVREPRESTSKLKRVRNLAARRLVYVRGDWHLWIYCCDWAVLEGSRLVGDSDSKRRIDRAARFLNGQKLVSARLIPRGMRSVFEFDLGGRLQTQPFDRSSEQWLLYEPNGNVLNVRADRRYSYGPGDRHPDRQRWLRINTF